MTKEIAKKQETGLAVTGTAEMAALAGLGMTNLTQDDLVLPYLRVLQSLSKECTVGTPEFLEEARAGTFFNSASKELAEKIKIIFCEYKRLYRIKDGVKHTSNYLGEMSSAEGDKLIAEKGLVREGQYYIVGDGRVLQETQLHYVMYSADSIDWNKALVAFSSSQLKIGKNVNYICTQQVASYTDEETGEIVKFTPPKCYSVFDAETAMQSNDDGNWFVFKLNRAGDTIETVGADVFTDAVEFTKSFTNYSAQEDAQSE